MKVVSIRRCHVCGKCNEAEQSVKRCTFCDKPFAPFFYFDDRAKPVQADYQLRPLDLNGQWRPIQGLTAYWEIY